MMTARLSGIRLALVALATSCALATSSAQTASAVSRLQPVPQVNRIAAQPDFGPKTQLSGHIPAWVQPTSQVASRSVDLSATMRFSVVLQRDPAVQAAFEQLLASQQDPSSPLYHQWLTPQQVGTLFGPTASDLAAVNGWLTAQGFSVDSVAPSRMILEVSGPTANVATAFRTTFGYFTLNGTPRFSAATDPFIPTALAPVIRYIYGLTDIPIEPTSHMGLAHLPSVNSGGKGGGSPDLTCCSGSHFMAPSDFSLIYDINSVYTGGNTGATIGTKAQHVAIIGRSNIATTDISEYAANTAIPSYNFNTIIASTNPGPVCTVANQNTCATGGDQGESTLDVDRVIGTAYGVQADLVISGTVGNTNGIYIAAAYNVNSLVDPVMTISYGACEANAGIGGVSLWDNLFSAGAAEGISTFVSSGDSGANGCVTSFTPTSNASNVPSPNYICSSSYATCVGGTEFNDANASAYWSTTNSAGLGSALSYIPEGGWNEPIVVGTSSTTYVPASSGGGASLDINKPTWQTGTGVPADGHRDTPDVSFSAAAHDGYYACLDFEQTVTTHNCTTAGQGYFVYFSGTSAAAPSMAAITALLNTKLGSAQGNLNPLLYRLAGTAPSAFHDITTTTSGVTGCSLTIPSMCNNSTPGSGGDATTYTGGVQGFLLTTGYDQVTGLGSLDVANFLTAALTASSFTITPTPTSLAFTSGATTGNAVAISVASVNNFTGSVALSCSISAGSAYFPPTCAVSPASVNVALGAAGAATVTITSFTAQAAVNTMHAGLDLRWSLTGGATFLALILLVPSLRRRRLAPLAVLALVALTSLSGCGGSSSPAPATPKSSAGTYTVTVSGTGTTTGATATTTFSLSIN